MTPPKIVLALLVLVSGCTHASLEAQLEERIARSGGALVSVAYRDLTRARSSRLRPRGSSSSA
jgi:hypothetical protein